MLKRWWLGPVSLLLVVMGDSVLAVVPGPPQSLTANVTGTAVTLNWQAASIGGIASSYVVEAALSPGGPVVASLESASTSVTVPNVPNGIYYVRVRGFNSDGLSEASNEVIVVVPGGGGGSACALPPNPPQNLTGSATGNLVTLNWSPPLGGCAATSFAVQAGSGPGLSNVTVANVGYALSLSSSAPTGAYYIRVVALNAFGGSNPSNEVMVRVGTVPPPPPPPPALGQFAVSTTAASGWTSIDVFANGNQIGTLTRYFEPGAPASCVAVPGARVVSSVTPGTVNYSARSDTGVSWSGSVQVAAGGCQEIVLTCTNRNCSPAPPPPPPPPQPTASFHVWGGPGYTQYLGFFTCTFCREFGADSINNEFGRYGSRFSSTSIRNGFSQFGSPFSSNSACNEFAFNPPRVYNASRTVFYGELTLNRFRLNAVSAWVAWLVLDVCEY